MMNLGLVAFPYLSGNLPWGRGAAGGSVDKEYVQQMFCIDEIQRYTTVNISEKQLYFMFLQERKFDKSLVAEVAILIDTLFPFRNMFCIFSLPLLLSGK
jgi:hypothetical protein